VFYDKVKYRRLSEEQKRLIDKLHEEGMGIKAIAKVLGVHPQTVNYCLFSPLPRLFRQHQLH